jgi:hypothetical protein
LALTLTTNALLSSQRTGIEPQIVLEIEGLDLLFGIFPVTRIIKYGQEGLTYGQENIFYGKVFEDPNSREYISKEGTRGNITQQILQDKGGTSSISTYEINLVDKNRELSEKFVEDPAYGDILTRNAKVFLMYKGTNFPDDANEIFQGIISNIEYGAGNLRITISHPEELKRQDIFEKIDVELDGAIDDTQTTIQLNSVQGILESADTATSYINIDDEWIEIGTVNNSLNQLEGCSRGALGTAPAAHDNNKEVSTFWVFNDNTIDMALKLMISGGPSIYSTLQVDRFIEFEGTSITNAIYFKSHNLNSEYGITVGDKIGITGASEAANNFTERNIVSIVSLGERSYITVDGPLLVFEEDGATASFSSLWNVYPDGLGMLPKNVDIERHLYYKNTYPSSFPTQLFYIKDTIEAKKFIDEQLYFVTGAYSIPRKGRSSMGYTVPPLSIENTPVIDERNITNLKDLKISRGINENYYNAIVYRYNEQLQEDKFLSGYILKSNESTNRIKNVRNRPLGITANGLRPTTENEAIIARVSQRLIDRYKFAAYSISNIKLPYKVGYPLEVGDIIAFGSENMNLRDPETGQNIRPSLYEVTNKKLNIFGGYVQISILNTAFALDSKFGVISPASILKDGSSATKLILQKSFGTAATEQEVLKWNNYIGSKIKVFNDDFTDIDESFITGFDPVLPDTVVISPPLSFIPDSSHYLELANYDDSNILAENIVKNTFAFISSSIDVTSGSSDTVFDVSDSSNIQEGFKIRVHSDDYTRDSDDVEVTDVTGNTITVESLGFTPQSSDIVEILNFADSNPAYRWI